MANSNADGSLILDTELDNTGFEKGSAKLLSSIDKLSTQIEKFGAAMEKAFTNPEALLRAASSAAQQAAAVSGDQARQATQSAEQIQHAQTQVINANANAEEQVTESQHRIISANTQAEEQVLQSQNQIIEANERAAEQITKAQGQVAGSNSQAAESISEYDKELAKLQKQIDATEKDLTSYHKEIEQIQKSTDEMLPQAATDEQAATIMEIEEQQIAKVNQKYADKLAVLEQLKGKYAEVEAARNAASNQEVEQIGNATQAVTAYDKELEKLEKKIASAKAALKSYYDAKAEIEASTDEMLPHAATDEQARIVMEIEEQEIERLNQKYATQIETLKNLEEEYARVNEARNQAAASQSEEADEEEETIQRGSRLSGVLVMLTQGFGRASNAALSLGKRIAQITFSAISTGAKKAVSSLKSFQKQASNTNFKANALVKSLTSLKRLLITRIKRMFISSLFNQVKEGLQKLAQYDSEFNTHMNSIKNSATQLNGNLAVALGNLISVVEPVITKVINLISRAIEYLNQFFALIQGKTSYTAAKMGADNYADSAKKAAKAQKEWNNELYSFDELNRQTKKDETSNDDDSATSGIQYETKNIDLPKGVQDWINRLKEAWKNGDWYGVGKIIAEGLNKAMQYVDDWINNKFRPWGVKWASRIAQILNGLVDGLDWELLGKTLADGFNALLDIANTFLKEFNFLNLGVGIGRAVNSLVDNIDWKLLAETLKNGFMGLINLAYGFLTTFDGLKLGKNIGQTIKDWFDGVDWNRVGETFALKWNALLHIIEGIVTTPGIWQSIGTSIGQFVRSWFSTIDINSLATILINILNGVTALIRSFLDQNPFQGVAYKVYTAINRVIHEVDWAALGKAISDLFMSVLKVIRQVVDNVDWKGVGQAIGNFLGSIDWWGIFTNVAAIVWEAFTGILSGLLSTDGGRMFLALVAAIKGLQLAFTLTQAGWKAAVQRWVLTGVSPFETMPTLIGGIGTKVKGALTTLTTFLTTGLTNFTVAGHTLLTGAAATFATAALAVTDALLLAYDVKSLNEAARTYKEAQNAHERETEVALSNFEKLYRTKGPEIAAQWAKTCYNIDTTGMSLDQAQKALVKQVDTYWDDTPQNMWDGFKQGWNTYFGADGKGLLSLLGDAFTGAIGGIKSLLGIHSPSTVFEGIGQNLVSGLLNGIKNAWSGITSFFTTGFTNLKTTFSNAWTNIKSTAGTAWEGIKSTISGKWNNITTAVSTGWNNLKTSLSNVKWDSIGSNMVSKIQSGVTSVWSRFSSSLVQGWTNIRESFGRIQWNNIGHNLVAGLSNGIGGAWSSLTQMVSNCANNLVSRIKSAFGIASPSKVFAEIGEYLDAGLEKGIVDGQKDLLGTATQMAEAVTNGMTPDSPDVEMSADAVVTGMQAVISGLSVIAETFKTIADTLTAAGGFTMPQIAEGTIVPYRTKVDDRTPSEDESEAVAGYLTSILAELQAMVKNAQNGGANRTIVLPVNINGHEVFQIIVDENNRAIQQRGSSPLRR